MNNNPSWRRMAAATRDLESWVTEEFSAVEERLRVALSERDEMAARIETLRMLGKQVLAGHQNGHLCCSCVPALRQYTHQLEEKVLDPDSLLLDREPPVSVWMGIDELPAFADGQGIPRRLFDMSGRVPVVLKNENNETVVIYWDTSKQNIAGFLENMKSNFFRFYCFAVNAIGCIQEVPYVSEERP